MIPDSMRVWFAPRTCLMTGAFDGGFSHASRTRCTSGYSLRKNSASRRFREGREFHSCRNCRGFRTGGDFDYCLGIAPRSIVTTCSTVRLAVSITICSRFHGR